MAYVLDANVFIQAADRLYPRLQFPGYWDWIETQSEEGTFASVIAVKNELQSPDELRAWSDGAVGIFRTPSEAVTNARVKVTDWVNAQTRFEDTARNRFLAGADSHLIAEALANNDIVVTYEVSAPESKTSVKIPDVCDALGVECVSPYIMLTRESPRFILDDNMRESPVTGETRPDSKTNQLGFPSAEE